MLDLLALGYVQMIINTYIHTYIHTYTPTGVESKVCNSRNHAERPFRQGMSPLPLSLEVLARASDLFL